MVVYGGARLQLFSSETSAPISPCHGIRPNGLGSPTLFTRPLISSPPYNFPLNDKNYGLSLHLPRMSSHNLLFKNGVLAPTTGNFPVSTFLESRPGAYTTTRTHDNASRILFWERHVMRLINSINILYENAPRLLFQPSNITPVSSSLPVIQSAVWDAVINSSVKDSLDKALLIGSEERRKGEELAITTLVSGNFLNLNDVGGEINEEEKALKTFDVYVHVGVYAPAVFGALDNRAQLALVGQGRNFAAAKYSDWVRLRKPLQKLKHPSTTELLLSNDGNRILEGSVSNFFVVRRKDEHKVQESRGNYLYEVQTAPVGDGVLPGVIRQLIIEVCEHLGIPIKENAPLWSEHETWEEAFITSSLRIMQDVKTILVPSTWESLESKTWEEVSWEEKHFQDGPGTITKLIQMEVMKKASNEGLLVK